MPDNLRDQIDLLHHIELLTQQINERMSVRSKSLIQRYPLTVVIIGLFGVVAVSKGIEGILEQISLFQNHPVYLLITGLIILTVLGLLYKKLDK